MFSCGHPGVLCPRPLIPSAPPARLPVGRALPHHPELIQRWPSQKGLLWPLSKNFTSSFPSQTSYSLRCLIFSLHSDYHLLYCTLKKKKITRGLFRLHRMGDFYPFPSTQHHPLWCVVCEQMADSGLLGLSGVSSCSASPPDLDPVGRLCVFLSLDSAPDRGLALGTCPCLGFVQEVNLPPRRSTPAQFTSGTAGGLRLGQQVAWPGCPGSCVSQPSVHLSPHRPELGAHLCFAFFYCC